MLRSCSQKLSQIIISELGYEKYDKEILEYGFEIMLGMTFKFFSILTVSLVLHTLPETMLSLFAFASIRNFAGGAHLKTYASCYATGVCMFALNGLIIKYISFDTNHLIIVSDIFFIISLFITLKWVPAGTEKKVVSDLCTRQKLKGITIIILGVLFILTHMFYFIGNYNLLKAIFFGVLEGMLFVTPLGYKILRISYH
ncbi:Accessory gene regulator B [Tepidanaerobacter acetatoxydans Re1]|uniref:Accessory gene regulator B n=1 Tax=Tepidanaerobacter acetatoxydans (strain DSM 21804 / JCM 16047 / Re1) TaxID=1209989 RepID=F4LQX9_TEPAE|nr:Accessory gene regulator B [Tepidanaerobacter acetatoxydans Re1]CDI40908.1 Accessory gene regulator B [Tepidanaerobacter acetatoxydans Re1]